MGAGSCCQGRIGGRSMEQRCLLHDFAAEPAVSPGQLPESRRYPVRGDTSGAGSRLVATADRDLRVPLVEMTMPASVSR